MDRWFGRWTLYQWLRPLIVGLVHGLAGSAAVALLVLTTVHNPHWALAYLFLFGVGTIAGMMVITVAMASALRYAGSRSRWIHDRLSLATGLLSFAFGLFIVYQMGFAHGLFTSHPTWTPE
jgi:high-affinity nickel-transport protein